MEGGESILDTLNEEEIFEDDEDVEMLDVEEGELVEHDSNNDLDQSNVGHVNQGSQSKNHKRRANKKKNKRKRRGPGSNVTDINRLLSELAKKIFNIVPINSLILHFKGTS